MKSYQALSGLLCVGLLTSCGFFESDPSPEDVQRIFGFPISSVSCVAAQGAPGRVCSIQFKGDDGSPVTRRFVKQADGWHAA